MKGHTHKHTHLTALFLGLPMWAGTRKVKPIWILLKQETVSGSSISWAICKSAPHHSVFTGLTPVPPSQQRQSTDGKKLVNFSVVNKKFTSRTLYSGQDMWSKSNKKNVNENTGYISEFSVNAWRWPVMSCDGSHQADCSRRLHCILLCHVISVQFLRGI